MNIIKNSRAFYILKILIDNNQLSYKQLKLIFKQYETTKDAVQKLVKAGYVNKYNKNKAETFYLTKKGVDAYNKRFGTSHILQI